MRFTYDLNGIPIEGCQDFGTGVVVLNVNEKEVTVPIKSDNGDLYFVYAGERVYFSDVDII